MASRHAASAALMPFRVRRASPAPFDRPLELTAGGRHAGSVLAGGASSVLGGFSFEPAHAHDRLVRVRPTHATSRRIAGMGPAVRARGCLRSSSGWARPGFWPNPHRSCRSEGHNHALPASLRGPSLGRVADGLDVVAVGVAHERAVVVGVVLGPHPRFVQHLGARRHRGVEERADRARSGAVNAMCDSRKPSPESSAPIQKSGFGGTPYPMATPKSMMPRRRRAARARRRRTRRWRPCRRIGFPGDRAYGHIIPARTSVSNDVVVSALPRPRPPTCQLVSAGVGAGGGGGLKVTQCIWRRSPRGCW